MYSTCCYLEAYKVIAIRPDPCLGLQVPGSWQMGSSFETHTNKLAFTNRNIRFNSFQFTKRGGQNNWGKVIKELYRTQLTPHTASRFVILAGHTKVIGDTISSLLIKNVEGCRRLSLGEISLQQCPSNTGRALKYLVKCWEVIISLIQIL